MELFRLLGTIAVDNSGAIDALRNTTEQAEDTGDRMSQATEKAESKMSKAFSKIGSAALKVGKVMATGIAVGSVAITTLGKTALDSYADFEQLVGGVETLFKESAAMVQEYADNAYKSAGMSANEYMETVTSFSASLLQSLDGDTAEAAKKANQAIVDMSDNANKMGSSMESIQNAYQGFAKANYTMLDNLKLGYGGTKEEMARLLKDAQAISGIEYDISSYADIVDAIHVIQEEMGIAGTTAKEASSTISGSISSMKSAWQNLLAGLGNEDADLSGLINNFVNSAGTVADNVLPRVEIILGGIADAIGRIVPIIGERLPVLFESILPLLIEGAVALMNGLIAALPVLLEILLPQVPFIVEQIGLALIAVFPQLLEVCQTLFGQLWDYFSLNLLNTGVSFQDTLAFIGEAFKVAWEVISTLWETIGRPVFNTVVEIVTWLAGIFEEKMPEIQAFFQSAISGIVDTWNNHLKPAFEAIGAFLENVLLPIFVAVFQTVIGPLISNTFTFIKNLWENTLKPVFDGICDFLTGVFTGDWQKAFDGLLSIATGIFEGIKNMIETNMNTGRDIVMNAIEKIKGFFNFEWSLPHLKMPHPTISGSFSLNPPSVPSFGIDWYAKAMDDPIIMNSPTAFGINKLGQVMAGGEAGSEVVSGTDTLMNMIAEAVSAKNARLEAILANILAFLMEMMPQMANMQMVTDTGVLIGELAPGMDEALGMLARREERGI